MTGSWLRGRQGRSERPRRAFIFAIRRSGAVRYGTVLTVLHCTSTKLHCSPKPCKSTSIYCSRGDWAVTAAGRPASAQVATTRTGTVLYEYSTVLVARLPYRYCTSIFKSCTRTVRVPYSYSSLMMEPLWNPDAETGGCCRRGLGTNARWADAQGSRTARPREKGPQAFQSERRKTEPVCFPSGLAHACERPWIMEIADLPR